MPTRKIAVNGMMIALVFFGYLCYKNTYGGRPFNLWGFGYNNSGSSFGKKERFSGGSHRVVGCGYCNGIPAFCTRHICRKRLLRDFVAGLVVHVLSKRFKEKYHVNFF